MSRTAPMLICAALLAACQSADAPTAPADAPSLAAAKVIRTHQRVEIIVDDVVPNECTNEMMQFHFNELMVAQDLEIVGRQFHAMITQMDRGSSGVGLTTGAHYRQVGRQGDTFFISAKIDEVETFTASTSVIGEGRVPDARGHVTFHMTVNPSGKLIVAFEKARFTCR
jgi:hypothetical protein